MSQLLCHLRHGNVENLITGTFDVLLNKRCLSLSCEKTMKKKTPPPPLECQQTARTSVLPPTVLSTAAWDHREHLETLKLELLPTVHSPGSQNIEKLLPVHQLSRLFADVRHWHFNDTFVDTLWPPPRRYRVMHAVCRVPS